MTVSRDEPKGEVIIAGSDDIGKRLDAFIAAQMPPHVSRSRIKDIIKQGGVAVNNNDCSSPNYRVKEQDAVVLQVPEAEEAIPQPEAIPLDIYFEDGHLLVVNKPAGMVVHPAVGNWTGTLVNALLHHCGVSLSGIGGVKRPGIVHRLDKETSGLLVVAKTAKAHAGLAAQFMDHGRTGTLKRIYRALVWGQFSPVTGNVHTFLGRSSNNRRKRAVVTENHPDGKAAITHYTVLAEHGRDKDGIAVVSLVECRLETGRTHQIRVHMSHIGHPLLGDQEYGKHFQTKENTLPETLQNSLKSFRRQALHAAILGFEHPVTNEILRFEAPIPADFANILSEFENNSLNN